MQGKVDKCYQTYTHEHAKTKTTHVCIKKLKHTQLHINTDKNKKNLITQLQNTNLKIKT